MYSEDNEILTLKDSNGRTLDCYIEHSTEVEDTEYFLILPVNPTISIVAWEDDGDDEIARLVEDEEEIDTIFAIAQAVLSEQNLSLKRTAYTLTASGELPDPDEDEILLMEVEDEDGENIETEELQLLATFYNEEQEYSVYTPVEPLLFFAKTNAKGEPELLSPEEFKAIQPLLQPLLEEDMFADL
jgi:Protein of unknown function (DUF3727)/Protein of unknown function (DUF1292)